MFKDSLRLICILQLVSTHTHTQDGRLLQPNSRIMLSHNEATKN